MEVILREAQKSDMESVLNLIKELAVFENEANEVELTKEELEQFGFNSNPSFQVFLAEFNGEIIGMALFYERFSTWKGKALHLEDLIVRQEHRNKGIGRALYDKVMSYAEEKKYKRVCWEVLDWNQVAIDFYESTGAKILPGWQVVHMSEAPLKAYVGNTKN
jgi:ribosomal protein S18 acetylase RimI-like enzyme